MRTAATLAIVVLALAGARGRQLQAANVTLADLVKVQLGEAKRASQPATPEVVVCEGEIALKCCTLDIAPRQKKAAAASSASSAAASAAPPQVVIEAPSKAAAAPTKPTAASSSASSTARSPGSGDGTTGGRRLRGAAAALRSLLSGAAAGYAAPSAPAAASSSATSAKASAAARSKATAECQPGDTTDICAQAAEVLALPTCKVTAEEKKAPAHPWLGGGKAAATAPGEATLYLNNTAPLMWTDGEEFVCVCPIKPEELVVTKQLPDVQIVESAPAKHPLLGAKLLPCPSAAGCSGGGSASGAAGK